MSLPEIPPQHHRPNFKQVIIDLLESIALEEIALSHILNAEAEKIQKFIHQVSHCTPTYVMIDFNASVNEMVETVIMKEWLLLRKLEKVNLMMSKHFSDCNCVCTECNSICEHECKSSCHCDC